MKNYLCFLCLFGCLAASASHVSETVTLQKGWNAIYLESTPTNLSCAAFFADSPVTRVGCYQTDAYVSTAQYASDGSAINQKPVSYLEWFADSSALSSLNLLFGGNCYVVYATNAWTKTFLGIPSQPRTVWRLADTSGAGFMNLAGVSAASDASVTATGYFGSGPFGAKGVAYQIGGSNEEKPTFLPLTLGGKSPKLQPGRAYALTGERAGEWSGVFRVGGVGIGGVDFGTSSTRESFRLANGGSAARRLRLTCRASAATDEPLPELSRLEKANPLDGGSYVALAADAAWEVDLPGDGEITVTLGLDRTSFADGPDRGAVIEIEDLSGSGLRVRVPVTASPSADTRRTGLWIGSVLLDRVSQMTNETPVAAQGTMKLTALLHVSTNGTATLLPQIAVASDTNRLARLFRSFESVPSRLADGARRITGGMMSLSNAGATSREGDAFGTYLHFSYDVAANARDNPFRHAWHPDHKNDDLNAIAVGNDVQFVWKAGMDFCREAAWLDRDADWLKTSDDPDGVTAGYVVWKMSGLAKGPVTAVGRFALQRVIVGELEEGGNEK